MQSVLVRTRNLFGAGILLTLVTLGAFASGSQEATEEADVDVITLGGTPVFDLPDGDTREDNEYTRFIEEEYGIKTEFLWVLEGDVATQKLGAALATGDIPDILRVDKTQLLELYESGLLADLTNVFEEQIDPGILEFYDAAGRDLILDEATIDGRLVAVPASRAIHAGPMLWIRKDWLENVGIEPKLTYTLEEIRAIADAFANDDPDGNGADDTIGFPVDPVLGGNENLSYSMDPVISHFGGRLKQWVHNESGEVVYGTTLPGTRDGLEFLATLYEDGLIDQDFAIRGSDERDELISAGEAGIYYHAWFAPMGAAIQNSLSNDPDADWVFAFGPVDEDGQQTAIMRAPVTHFLAISKDADVETAIDLINVSFLLEFGRIPEASYIYEGHGNLVHAIPLQTVITPVNFSQIVAEQVEETIRTGNPPEDIIDARVVTIAEKYEAQQELENPRSNPVDWGYVLAWKDAMGEMFGAHVDYVAPAFFMQTSITPTMETRWATLSRLEDEMLVKIILGEESIEYFDEFVDQWSSLGGETITEEVNAAVE